MTAIIYQTENMEAAATVMTTRNHHCIILRHHRTKRSIRLRGNELVGIPQTIARPWDEFVDESIARWKLNGGILQYSRDYRTDKLPNAEAMLFVEAPFQYSEFETQIQRISREVIVYRPPSWDLHEESIGLTYPTSNIHHTVECVIQSLFGTQLPQRLQVALKLSGRPDRRTAVFESATVTAMTGISEQQIGRVLRGIGFRANYDRYHCYTPMIAPDDTSHFRWAYDMVEALDPAFENQRMLRFDCLAPKVTTPGLTAALKGLVRGGFLTRHPHIYVVAMGYRPVDYLTIDAIAMARRGEWFKMKNVVDSAPKYPLKD